MSKNTKLLATRVANIVKEIYAMTEIQSALP